jgi:hypothetical protein
MGVQKIKLRLFFFKKKKQQRKPKHNIVLNVEIKEKEYKRTKKTK